MLFKSAMIYWNFTIPPYHHDDYQATMAHTPPSTVKLDDVCSEIKVIFLTPKEEPPAPKQ